MNSALSSSMPAASLTASEVFKGLACLDKIQKSKLISLYLSSNPSKHSQCQLQGMFCLLKGKSGHTSQEEHFKSHSQLLPLPPPVNMSHDPEAQTHQKRQIRREEFSSEADYAQSGIANWIGYYSGSCPYFF